MFQDINYITLILGITIPFAVFYGLSSTLSSYLLRTLTAVVDLEDVGKSRKNGKISGSAVVCGGSISGLFAARVLADHFENVIIIHPEEWAAEGQLADNGGKKRPGVFQYEFLHLYQKFLGKALPKMFPDIEKELRNAGNGHIQGTVNIFIDETTIKGDPTDSIFASRHLLETTVRRLLLSRHENVSHIHGTAESVVGATNVGPLEGVNVHLFTGEETYLPAAIVVDCTGTARCGLRWLKQLQPEYAMEIDALKDSYNHNVTYTSIAVEVPESVIATIKPEGPGFENPTIHEKGLQGMYAWFPDAERERCLVGVVRHENNSVQVAFGGWGIRDSPKNIEDLRNMTSSLSYRQSVSDWFFQMLETLAYFPAKVTTYRLPPAVHVDYVKAKNFLPSNFIALGDSVLQLNPVRGEGVTKASIDAISLNGILTQCKGKSLPRDFGRRFFALQNTRTGSLWGSGKVADYAWDTTVPSKTDDLAYGKAMRMYTKLFLKLTKRDAAAGETLFRVTHFLEPPTSLLTPKILIKIIGVWIRREWAHFRTKTDDTRNRPPLCNTGA